MVVDPGVISSTLVDSLFIVSVDISSEYNNVDITKPDDDVVEVAGAVVWLSFSVDTTDGSRVSDVVSTINVDSDVGSKSGSSVV